ncbi:MAG: hypothetical protein HKM89_07755 [Gemmatimonadales bacterium]|nr:hypothetical protein [Gemmatimonadales bacterium]
MTRLIVACTLSVLLGSACSRPAAHVRPGNAPERVDGYVFLEFELDHPPRLLATPPPNYPEELRPSGLEGVVTLEFVLDTLGHAEPNSFKTMSATHPGFIEPAREYILGMVFAPGRLRGRAIRVLMARQVTFSP